jgi:hypothetical protein
MSGKSFRFNFTSNRNLIYDVIRISKTQIGAKESCLISSGGMHDERVHFPDALVAECSVEIVVTTLLRIAFTLALEKLNIAQKRRLKRLRRSK